MPRKTFAFSTDPEKVLEDFFDLFIDATALTVALKRRLAEEGQDTAWVTDRMRKLDDRLLKLIRDARRPGAPLDDLLTASVLKFRARHAPLSDHIPPPPSQP